MGCGQAAMRAVIMNEPRPSQTAKGSPLFEAIASQIEQGGPLSLAKYIGLHAGGLSMGQILSLPMMLLGLYLLRHALRPSRDQGRDHE